MGRETESKTEERESTDDEKEIGEEERQRHKRGQKREKRDREEGMGWGEEEGALHPPFPSAAAASLISPQPSSSVRRFFAQPTNNKCVLARCVTTKETSPTMMVGKKDG